MRKNQNLKAALMDVRAFIKTIAEDTRTPGGSEEHRGFYFWRADNGTIYLDNEDASRYRQVLHELFRSLATDQISIRATEKAFQNAIFKALDIRQQRNDPLSTRLDQAIEELSGDLTRTPQVFRVYCRVLGLASDGLPSRFGSVEFMVFDEAQLAIFQSAIEEHRVREEQRAGRYKLIEELGAEENFANRVVAAIEVSANDGDAAQSLAIRELRLTTDVLNFYSDLVPYSKAYVSLPGDAHKENVVIPHIVTEGSKKASFSINHVTWGRIGELSLPRLWEMESKRQVGFSRVDDLLRQKPNSLEERIVASLQWAGRATAEMKREEAFLLYAIALESVVLSDNIPTELTYRLKLRIAHLLGRDLQSRRELFEEIGNLYNIRSKIVHSGSFQVTDADLSTLRAIAKSALIRILIGEEFQSIVNPKQLGEWFQDHALHGGADPLA